MTSFLKSNSIFNNSSIIKSLLIRLRKKNVQSFSKSQPLRTRLIRTNVSFRLISLRSSYLGIPATVLGIHYDPYRSSGLLLVTLKNGICSYYLNIDSVSLGDSLMSSFISSHLSFFHKGNSSTLHNLPTGASISQIELKHNHKYSLSSGCSSVLLRKQYYSTYGDGIAVVKLSSGSLKKISLNSFATVGVSGNFHLNIKKKYKAGQNRWLGRRPIVRGVAKNPVDHGHGGGEGKKSQTAIPKTFWGKQLKWKKTSRVR